ncbi:basement membrane-specific heparan sulfate proteoglycan core protein-like [Xiphophorus hellerii]|uniref:basement membrane-specific heparan sulfate proteoglycan core protein-like n=1 Tax=Xiphophorus hellerii TaxID=8084 RepID=UPI0013B3E022|nr:basement membrane-specific heparan sulfate proteoglycan core protein-like [Xiphophorus hellerii]
MGKELLLSLSFFVLCVVFYGNTQVSKPTVILQPSGPFVYSGEKVTLRCEIWRAGGRTQWTYEWKRNNGNTEKRSKEYRINRVSDTNSGQYSCIARGGHQLTEWSDAVTLTVRPDKPRAKLTAVRAIIPAGGRITLSCSVDESDNWKFDWFRNYQQYSADQFRGTSDPNRVISVSDEGVYSCRGGRGDPVFQTEKSEDVLVLKTISKPTVILQPNRTVVYSGEKVTLRCEIHEGGTEWTYEWKRNNGNVHRRSGEYRTITVDEFHSGQYSCMARGDHQLTEWSDAVTLTVRPDEPRAKLTADRTIIPAGGRITLSCSVDESDDWKFDWFRNYQQYSADQFRGSSEPYSVISVSEGGVYSCRGGRGDPVFQTEKSEDVLVLKTISKPTVILQPNRTVVYSGEKVTLRCEIHEGGTEWTYEWKRNNGNVHRRSGEYRTITVDEFHSGQYSCMARGDHQLTEWSDAVTLTMRPDEPRAKLTADRTIIPPGGSITLSCSVDESDDWKFDWFRNDQQYSVDQFRGSSHKNSVISVSKGGEYSCRGGRGDPVFHTEKMSGPTVNQHPSWPVVFRGETVTLRCEMQDDEGTQWTYEWSPSNRKSPTSNEYRISSVSESDSGSYRCLARKGYQRSGWSFPFKLTVNSNRPKASIKASANIIPAGGSVRLTCFMDIGVGWKVDWFRLESKSSTAQPIRTNESDGVLSISEGGEYSCRGGRGDPVFYTEKSNVQKIVSGPTVNRHPSWPVVFRGETVTLRCEMQDDEGTQWTYEWSPSNRKSPTSNEYKISSVSESDSGSYWCKASKGNQRSDWSSEFKLTVNSNRPKASLTASANIIPAGGSVTLTCFINIGVGWKFDWFRLESKSSTAQPIRTNESDGVLSISEGGEYSCRGGRGDPVFYTETSREVTIQKTVPITPTVIQHPNWAKIYRGERVTLRCEIQDDGGTQWTYEWRPTNINSPTSSEFMITADGRGYYSCRGRRDSFTFTEWGVITLTVLSSKPQPVLSVSPSWPNPGASVTLSCEGLKHQSAGWRFFWFKTVPDISQQNYRPFYSYELLPGSTNGTEQNSFIINGPTHTAGFVCRAGRGEPKFYTDYSELKFVWSAGSAAASLTVSPDRVQHFMSESVTLTCKGNSTDWRVKMFTETDGLSDVTCSNWGRMTGSTCTIDMYWSDSRVYWCESGSGEFSNAVNITVQDDYRYGVILVSPVHPVTEGDPVTLICRDKKQKLLSNVFFYHNNKLINNDSREELNISAVSKSDEGFYKCQHSGKESPRSWMSVRVTVSSPVSSSFPVMLVVGSVVGIVLIILLLLLWRCRRSKDSRCISFLCFSSNQSESSNQSSNRNDIVNQTGSHDYNALVHDNVGLYESVKTPEAAGDGDAHFYESVKYPETAGEEESEGAAYCLVEVVNVGHKRKPHERTSYSVLRTGDSGTWSPAATDEAVYSEIAMDTASEAGSSC